MGRSKENGKITLKRVHLKKIESFKESGKIKRKREENKSEGQNT